MKQPIAFHNMKKSYISPLAEIHPADTACPIAVSDPFEEDEMTGGEAGANTFGGWDDLKSDDNGTHPQWDKL